MAAIGPNGFNGQQGALQAGASDQVVMLQYLQAMQQPANGAAARTNEAFNNTITSYQRALETSEASNRLLQEKNVQQANEIQILKNQIVQLNEANARKLAEIEAKKNAEIAHHAAAQKARIAGVVAAANANCNRIIDKTNENLNEDPYRGRGYAPMRHRSLMDSLRTWKMEYINQANAIKTYLGSL